MSVSAEEVRAYYVRLATRDYDIDLDEVGHGPCNDCGEIADPRYRYGRVDLCLHDLIARAKFRARQAA
jgi:hypothetical protein